MNFITRIALILTILAASAVAARADLVTDWNGVVYDMLQAGNVEGAPAARILAIVHVSMADAINTAQNRYTRYAYQGKLQPGASPEAAVASAAHHALVSLFPAHRTKIEEVYAANIRAIADRQGKDAGAALGAEAAAAVIADRADDKTSVPDAYRPVTAAGVWIPTTPPLTAQ